MAHDEIISGWHAVMAALKYAPASVRVIWFERDRRDPRIREAMEIVRPLRIGVNEEDAVTLDRLTGGARHQGVAARCIAPETRNEDALPDIIAACKDRPPLLLVLDQVQDPHNLGACLRSANAAGVHAVIVPADRSVGLTPTVRMVASGGAESVPFVQVTNLARALRELKEQGVWLIGGAGEAEGLLYSADFTGPTAIVLGAEEGGLRRLTRETCDSLVRIPMSGSVESLNVSVAAGVFLFEAVRQRMK